MTKRTAFQTVLWAIAFFMLSLLVFQTSHADVGEQFKFDRFEGNVTTKVFGGVNDGYCQSYTNHVSVYVASSTFRGGRNGTPSDYVYGLILDSNKNIVATSTNWIQGSTLSTGAGYYYFYYDNVFVASTTSFFICVKRSGAQDATNNYDVTGDTAGVSPTYGQYLNGTSTATSLAMQSYTQTYGYTYFPPCVAGGGDSSMCITPEDMATTTLAIQEATNQAQYFFLFLVWMIVTSSIVLMVRSL